MESNDSFEIPDRGETSDIPGLPSGEKTPNGTNIQHNSHTHALTHTHAHTEVTTTHKEAVIIPRVCQSRPH